MTKEYKLKLEKERIELINDVIATTTVMEELWNYHPDNPNKKEVVKEYRLLEKLKIEVEDKIKNIDQILS
jgi:hypothetical protein|tara:strand:- start:286 stop:495 length:210 start_codon:yes stop_codon:yes gene_type:complete